MSKIAMSRQEQFSGTKAVSEHLRFDEKKLEDYMSTHIENFSTPLKVEQFKGGQSNPTYALSTPRANYVLRRQPPGKLLPSAHAVDREFRVISGLYQAGFPVPRPYLLCLDKDVVGTMFYIMDRVEGRICWEGALPKENVETRRGIYQAMGKTIADLHRIDYQKVGLESFGKPGNYFARQIGRWSKQYLASETETIPAMHRLIDWLPNNIPEGDETAIVHGDYRLDNIILHPRESRILAVLDWELSTLGHPLGDFTYHLMQWRMPSMGGVSTAGLAQLDLSKLGIPSEREYIAAYCRRTEREGIENIDYYFAYNFFRIAGILQGIVGRVRDGTASSEHASRDASAVRSLAELGWRYAQDAGAG